MSTSSPLSELDWLPDYELIPGGLVTASVTTAEDEPLQPSAAKKRRGETGAFGITPTSAARTDTGQRGAMFDVWRDGGALMKRRKSFADVFLEAAADLCRNAKSATRQLVGDVVKLAHGLARCMAEIRLDLEEAFGVKLTWADIEDLKRKAERDRVERDAAERWQIIEEWLAAERQRLEARRHGGAETGEFLPSQFLCRGGEIHCFGFVTSLSRWVTARISFSMMRQ
jgi:hypothetical protein